MSDLDRLDRELAAAGEDWRATLPPPPPVAAVWRGPAREWTTRGGFAALAAVIAIALSAVVIGGSGRPQPSGPPVPLANHVSVAWNEPQLVAAVVHRGDAVVATGTIVLKADGSAAICTGGAVRLSYGGFRDNPPTCTAAYVMSVPLLGLDAGQLPEPEGSADLTYDLWARVEGTWTGTAISVTKVSRPPTPQNPFGAIGSNADVGECPAPPAGWIEPSDPADFRKALGPLASDIAAHQELYGGFETQGMLGLQDTSSLVEIVRARVDPASLRSRVAVLFPYAVCITGLNARQPEPLVVIDDAAVRHFAQDPKGYPEPLVRKVNPSATAPIATLAPTLAQSLAPSSTPNGFELPTEIDGRPVLVGDAAVAAFQAATDATPMLVGGWMSAPVPMFCPMLESPNPFWACSGVFLRSRPYGGPTNLVLHITSSDLSLPVVPADQVVPLVFEVHTHDAACALPLVNCVQAPVIDRVMWSGTIGPVPTPTSTEPPNGIREATAKADAIAAARERSSGPVQVLSARVGHYAEVGPPGSMDVDGDRWVWAVVVSAAFTSLDCADPPCDGTTTTPLSTSLIVLDYVTGDVLIQVTPAPSS